MDPIIESFSYITSASGKKYQVLRFRLNEETGEQEPYDSDVGAAAELAAKEEISSVLALPQSSKIKPSRTI